MVFLLKALDALLDLLVAGLLKLVEPDVGVAVDAPGIDRMNSDHIARNQNVHRIRQARAMYDQPHAAAAPTTHHADGAIQRHRAGRLIVDLDDLIARFDSGPVRRRILHRIRDGEHAVLDRHRDPDTSEAAARVDFEVAVALAG